MIQNWSTISLESKREPNMFDATRPAHPPRYPSAKTLITLVSARRYTAMPTTSIITNAVTNASSAGRPISAAMVM